MSFKEKICGLMRELDLSQAQLAKMTGINPSSISQYVTGINRPSKARRKIIAAALGVAEDYFEEFLPIEKVETGFRIRPEDVAPLLHCSTETVRAGLIGQRFPWGYAVKRPNSSKWTFIICPIRFTQETGIELPTLTV